MVEDVKKRGYNGSGNTRILVVCGDMIEFKLEKASKLCTQSIHMMKSDTE